MTIQVELDTRRLGGSALLIPFSDNILTSTTCRNLLQTVLIGHLDQPDFLQSVEKVIMFVIKQHDNVSGSGRKTRVDKDLANATTCLDMFALYVIESFSTPSFNFKLTSKLTVAPQARSLLNAFEVLKRTQTTYVCLAPRLEHARMYLRQSSQLQRIASVSRRAPARLDNRYCQNAW
jgi:hypothetical protein